MRSMGVEVPLLEVQRALAHELTVLLDVTEVNSAAGAPQAVVA
jgi:lipoyl(octanoyl) transferase